MVEFINTEKLIERFDDMARRESLLVGKQVTQDDLVCQIVGTIVKEAMDELRAPVDKLEVLVERKVWPMPTYGDLLFEI